MTENASGNQKGHRLEEVMGYRNGYLAGREKAAFEAHLKECPACQADLKAAGGFLDALKKEVAKVPGKSTDEILALMEKRDAELRAQGPARAPTTPTPVWAYALAAAALVLAGIYTMQHRPQPEAPKSHDDVSSPSPSRVAEDGGR